MFLYEITDEFERQKLKYAIVGGYALAIHGIVRATMDVDIVLHLLQSQFELAELALKKLGLTSRLPIRAQDVIKLRKEYIENRNLIAWSFVDFQNPSRQVDILITKELSDLKPVKIKVGNRKINVASLEDLLKMKQEAGRDQDLIDVKNIREKLSEKKKK